MKKTEKVCATCKHLQWLYKVVGGDTWCFCPVYSQISPEKGTYIRVSQVWNTTCDRWEGKE